MNAHSLEDINLVTPEPGSSYVSTTKTYGSCRNPDSRYPKQRYQPQIALQGLLASFPHYRQLTSSNQHDESQSSRHRSGLSTTMLRGPSPLRLRATHRPASRSSRESRLESFSTSSSDYRRCKSAFYPFHSSMLKMQSTELFQRYHGSGEGA
jgi:hypothetical protein